MSSIWDPSDPPEVIAAEKAAAERADGERAEARVTTMRARYAKAAACSILTLEDHSEGLSGDVSEVPEEHRFEPKVPPRASAAARGPSSPPRSSPAELERRAGAEAARKRLYADLLSSMPPALAAWRPGLPLPRFGTGSHASDA